MPAGLYDGRSLEKYVHEALTSVGRSDDFAALQRELYIVATDFNSGERVVFSKDENFDVPISRAVAASTCLPPIYKPVAIGNKVYVDGGLRGTASLDIAREHGADLIVCINPLVPYNNSALGSKPFFSPDGGYLTKKGMQAILSQSSRITTHTGLHYQVKQIREHHPNIDVIVIEPRPDDCQMFYYNMRYSVLLMLAEHGFESVTLHLAEDYPNYKQILARHGIPLSRRIVVDELREIQESGYDPEVIRLVLEKRSSSCNRIRGDCICELSRVLAELEMTLDSMTTAGTVATVATG